MRATSFVILAVTCGCGARTELGAPSERDASADVSRDASVDHASEADVFGDGAPDAPQLCDYGTIVSDAFGAPVFWNGGAPVPAGHYRITYVDGCLKYSSTQGWSVNAYANGPDTLFVITNTSTTLGSAPGTVGFLQGQGGFATFDDCVKANLSQDTPLDLEFSGGALGAWLSDVPYTDNVSGENGRNPAYRLSSCP